ncbi:MAG: TIGR03087 family PEP-CTERM/XrtA system glycosyltransferase [Methylococcaceae bacterium]|nr:TIGR03087 family PEP-CTERM/XrtA system glycosyltransferase [Methylococcaceae bacterium]
MKELLFLIHRIPFPPNKGDKIRSYHILKHLSLTYRVHVGAFVDDSQDWRHAEDLKDLCGEMCLLPLNPLRSKLASLSGFLTGEALSLPYYRNAEMSAWVDRIVRERPLTGILIFSSAMAQYVEKLDSYPRVLDFVDVDSDKWRQYAEKKSWPLNWVYRREGRRLLDFDRRMAKRFDQSLFVSEHEASLFKTLAPESADKVFALEMGVDTDFFDAGTDYVSPYPEGTDVLVFTGAMDYWANVDAVTWLAREVFPQVLRLRPAARFYIVGVRPTPAVLALGKIDGVVVTGAVKEIRPYLAHARLAVAPLRIARGIQSKVLEAMAMGKSVIASSKAMEGIVAEERLDLRVADEPENWVHAIVEVLENSALPERSSTNRAFILNRYSWERNLSRLDHCWEAP